MTCGLYTCLNKHLPKPFLLYLFWDIMTSNASCTDGTQSWEKQTNKCSELEIK